MFNSRILALHAYAFAIVVVILGVCAATATCSDTGGARDNGKPVHAEKLSDKVTRLIYKDGREVWEVMGRDSLGNDMSLRRMTFVPAPAQAGPYAKPRPAETRRGYILFCPASKDGVLPDYHPSFSEMTDKVSLFACPGESEPATFAIRPVKDMGKVTFSLSDFVGPRGARIRASATDVYIVQLTADRIGHTSDDVHWTPKWLRPTNVSDTSVGRNVQVFVDVHIPANAVPGRYSTTVAIAPERADRSSLALDLEVLPLKLERPMPWGFFSYGWEPFGKKQVDNLFFEWSAMRRAGITHCVISPSNYNWSPDVAPDGTMDFAAYDKLIELYKQAGFEDPLGMSFEGLLRKSCDAIGKSSELGFKDGLIPSVRADQVPSDVREFVKKNIRRIYDHSLEANWPPFYVYYVDEPVYEERKMEAAKLMYGLTREVAPELQTADTVYSTERWAQMKGLLDLNISSLWHSPAPCDNLQANQDWRKTAEAQHSKLHGIDFVGPREDCRLVRQLGLAAEKAGLDGMTCWIQFLTDQVKTPLDPYWFLRQSANAGPWVLRDQDGHIWLSLPFIGLREGIDDSRYVRTVRKMIADSEANGDHKAADKARTRLREALDRVPWLPAMRDSESVWRPADCDLVRRRIAEAVVECAKSATIEHRSRVSHTHGEAH